MSKLYGGQCPGEARDIFWEEPIQRDTLTVEQILKRYNEMQAQRPSYYVLKATNVNSPEGGLTSKFDSFETAIKIASMLQETGCWVLESLERQQ